MPISNRVNSRLTFFLKKEFESHCFTLKYSGECCLIPGQNFFAFYSNRNWNVGGPWQKLGKNRNKGEAMNTPIIRGVKKRNPSDLIRKNRDCVAMYFKLNSSCFMVLLQIRKLLWSEISSKCIYSREKIHSRSDIWKNDDF